MDFNSHPYSISGSNPWGTNLSEAFRPLLDNSLIERARIEKYRFEKETIEKNREERARIEKETIEKNKEELAKSWKTFTGKNNQPYYYNASTGERTYIKPT